MSQAIVRLQPLALIDKCIGSKIWVIMKVYLYVIISISIIYY
jgi:hypothetical protein